MSKKNISQEKIIQSFISSAFEKSAGGTSLADIAESLEIKKASLYNHFESRDAMYFATLKHCKKEIEGVSFLPEKTLDSIKNNKASPLSLFKRLITRYFELYEAEPLFEIYVFIHTEQYFNLEALQIVEFELDQITNDIKTILQEFSNTEKIIKKSDKELKDIALAITTIIFHQRDIYIAKRKETMRQNPEAGAGSLFALPTDESAVNKAVKLVEGTVKSLLAE